MVIQILSRYFKVLITFPFLRNSYLKLQATFYGFMKWRIFNTAHNKNSLIIKFSLFLLWRKTVPAIS